jgi:hypothetical protein
VDGLPCGGDGGSLAGDDWVVIGGVCLAGLICILKTLPETRGQSLDQIENELEKR